MIETTDTIEGSGHPLAFRQAMAGPRAPLFGAVAGAGVLRVEARAMGGHQKEAVITEGEGAGSWRVVSDEGPILGGSDLAPFPLGFFSAGLQGDLTGRILTLAPFHSVVIDALAIKLENRYAFTGSFLAGTGQGSTRPAGIDVSVQTSAQPSAVMRLITAAIDASPAIAALRAPLANTFAIYVNGKRGSVEGVHASAAADAVDPFMAHAGRPAPVRGADQLPGLITRLREPDTAPAPLPASGARVDIVVSGESSPGVTTGTANVETRLLRPTGTWFGLKSDERPAGEQAPSGLALMSAGISFCYLTQLLRYVEYRKHKVRAIRLVQYNPYSLQGSAALGSLRGAAGPVDTHLFLNAGEPDDVMQKLLLYSARTCYLHAALGSAYDPEVTLSINGAASMPVTLV